MTRENGLTESSVYQIIEAAVVFGDRRGRELGFPTANILHSLSQVPDGVYAGWYDRPSGERWPTAISVGRRATFYAEAFACSRHISSALMATCTANKPE